ncbi:Serine carboxypeptidase-like 35 [Tripterygium wilfordii]|uniref:Carboxypeptidase n=1 Tax=Tripterygium wilfordii TaxID=458696 RepID=A0A7J7DU36_TRIWF|nr:serine carboxypeptidase-like 35 [Tripterygium wilfordii]KAF5749882.1 Serine carboxypeptidase-like 35 [Tripterygium wilfordii]
MGLIANVWSLLLALLAIAAPYLDENTLSAQQADKVTNLPGQPPVKFEHYAGSIKLYPNDTKAMFYWFLEAATDAAEKPVVVWLNGGPGCSSVAEGAALEIGPFLLDGSQFQLNPFSWNKVANMLFLETPVGVGFSYSNNSQDYDLVGDHSTALDNLAFLVNWYKKFPNFKTKQLYISGESYAGHFAPQLADLIMDWNKGAAKDSINLKGIMMGNVVINDPTDADGIVDYAHSHGVISGETYRDIEKECNFNNFNQTEECVVAFEGLAEAYAEIDMFNIHRPVCQNIGNISPSSFVVNAFHHDVLRGKGVPHKRDMCSDYATPYFNRPDVQLALHANVTGLPYPFWICSPIIRRWIDSPTSVLPTIRKLLDAGQRIWIFSGEFDGRVPVTSTNYSIAIMGLKVEEEWRHWFKNGEVAGQVQTYKEGITFVTVTGAGHQVPVDKPGESLFVFSHFLANRRLPRF